MYCKKTTAEERTLFQEYLRTISVWKPEILNSSVASQLEHLYRKLSAGLIIIHHDSAKPEYSGEIRSAQRLTLAVIWVDFEF